MGKLFKNPGSWKWEYREIGGRARGNLVFYQKNIISPNQQSESSLLKPFQKYKIFLYREKQRLEFRQ